MPEKKKRHLQDVLGLIPQNLISNLSKETKVDHYAKVLSGERMFNLLLYGILTTNRTSQRVLEDVFSSGLFKHMFCYDPDMTVTHSSISTRLSKIDPEFFRLIYEYIYAQFSKHFTKKEQLKYKINRVDSTMVAETCNKLKKGLSPGKKPQDPDKQVKKQLKYTISFDGLTGNAFKIYSDKSYLSEDLAIPELILECAKKEASIPQIYVFDRGVSSADKFKLFNDQQISFVGRLKTDRMYEIVEKEEITEENKDLGTLNLISSQTIYLYNSRTKNQIVNINID